MDVTLACEDDDQLTAHKVVLSACSPFFRTVLRRNPHQHPLLYMKGIRYNDLESLLNFMYYGEVNIAQEELNSFLAVAEELQVKGLTQKENTASGSSSQKTNNLNTSHQTSKPINNISSNPTRPRVKTRPEPSDDVIEELPITNVKTEPPSSSDHPVASYEEDQYQDYQEYPSQNYSDQYSSVSNYQDNQIVDNSAAGGGTDFSEFALMNSESQWQCSICGKQTSQKSNLLKHIENIHYPGTYSYTCHVCNKIFQNKNSFYKHQAVHK